MSDFCKDSVVSVFETDEIQQIINRTSVMFFENGIKSEVFFEENGSFKSVSESLV